MHICNCPEVSEPGRPVQWLVVEPLYRCRRPVALSVLLRCSAQRYTRVGNLQACWKCRRLSWSGLATSTMISHRLAWCRRGRSRSRWLPRNIRSNNLGACPGNSDVRSPEIPIIYGVRLEGVRLWKASRRRVQAPLHQSGKIHMARSRSLLSRGAFRSDLVVVQGDIIYLFFFAVEPMLFWEKMSMLKSLSYSFWLFHLRLI